MKNNLLLAFVLVLGLTGFVMIHNVAAEDAPVNVGNKICPVSGEAMMEGQEATVEYKGKVYNLCCGMCKKDFLKEPEKYIQVLKDKGEVK